MDKNVVKLLTNSGLVSCQDIAEGHALLARGGGSLAGALIRLGVIGDEALAEFMSRALDLPLLQTPPAIAQMNSAQLLLRFSSSWLVENEVLVWLDDAQQACIAYGSGSNLIIAEAIEQWKILPSNRFVIAQRSLRALLNEFNERSSSDRSEGTSTSLSNLEELAEDAPAIEFINAMFSEAIARRASDIHIEPFKGDMQIRLRIDGTLQLWRRVPALRFAATASRLKLLCGMDIAERRIPQDGRHSLRIAGRDVDIRASCLPGVWGESIVLRFLGRTSDLPSLAELGVCPSISSRLEILSLQPSGLLLVAGPTGSGKTTTVYKVLEGLNDGTRKIITIEDPVEIDLPGVIQVNVRQDIGLEFATGLRSMLRQDPDVIFVGEIRDTETAQMATRAALTGHLVISTVHTGSAVASVARILDLGVEGYLLAEALSGVLAQRLLRRCDQTTDKTYSGRIGVYELFEVNPDLREAIRQNASNQTLEDMAATLGYAPMRSDALAKVAAGQTDLDEVMRVLGR